MIKVSMLFFILSVIPDCDSFAEMRKCVNDAGSVAFTNTGICPQGYSTKSVTKSTKNDESVPTGNPVIDRYQKQYDDARAALATYDSAYVSKEPFEEGSPNYNPRAYERRVTQRKSSAERLNLVRDVNHAHSLLLGSAVPRQSTMTPALQPAQPSNPALKGPHGVINPYTGEYYPPTAGGVVNPRTGTYYQETAGGYVDTRTGKFIPAQ